MKVAKKKRKNGKSKGNNFERKIATQLSLWWSEGERTDLFWRSSSSGARATSRAQKNKTTANSAGDLCYLDATGKPLIDYFAVECKVGYPGFELQRVVDREENSKPSLFEQWLLQATQSQQDAKSKSWLIIAKKNRAQALAILPISDFEALSSDNYIGTPFIIIDGLHNHKGIICLPLDKFLEHLDPQTIRNYFDNTNANKTETKTKAA